MSKKEMAMPPLVLTIICLVVTAALVGTYQFTKPYIAEAKAAAADEARREVFPGNVTFTLYEGALEVEGVTEVYEAYEGDVLAGYVVTSTSQGFGGPLVVMTGFDADGNITGTKLVENAETPGLGTKVGETDHTSLYLEKNVDTYTEVDAISGATISSDAFKEAVSYASQAFKTVAGGASK